MGGGGGGCGQVAVALRKLRHNQTLPEVNNGQLPADQSQRLRKGEGLIGSLRGCHNKSKCKPDCEQGEYGEGGYSSQKC